MAHKFSGTEDFRGPILEYLSQEINSHAAMIVGFAVVLFAYLDIVVRDFFEPIQAFQFGLPSTQNVLIFIVLVGIVWSFLFTLFRLCYYGAVTHATLRYEGSTSTFNNMWTNVTTIGATTKIFGIFPAGWFDEGVALSSTGLWVCLTLSIAASLLLELTLFFRW